MAKSAPAGALTRRDESLVATVTYIRFAGEQADGFTAVTFTDGTRGVGNIRPDLPIREGDSFLFSGRWQEHEKHGRQFRWSAYVLPPVADEPGVLAYLTRYVDGIGEARAKRMWDAYGERAVKTLREHPEVVTAAGILSLDDALAAAKSLTQIAGYEATYISLLSLFDGRGWPLIAIISAAIGRWRVRAPEVIRRDPFAMLVARLPGAGFVRCDSLYLALGRPRNRLKRLMLCLWDELATDMSGNTWQPVEFVRRALASAVVGAAAGRDREADCERALAMGVRSRWIARRTDERGRVWVAEGARAASERRLADRVHELMEWVA